MTVEEWLGSDNELGIDIWNKKYRFNNESFDEWLDRVSGGNKDVRNLIQEKKFLFGGRTLANRGTGKKGSFSNCYSRGFIEDNLDDLMQASVDIAKTFKAQGGQGLSLSKIRPKGAPINHGQFQSDGIIPFMEIYNRITESVSQGGSRKGALLMSLDAWHKEAEDFIKIKSEEGRIQKANLSLEIDNEFMECVSAFYKTGKVITKTIKREYDGGSIEYEVTPINLYKLMMQKAYDWGEPGCLFVNALRNYNLMQYCDDYQIETVNPCGEQPLPKHGACNLGSINLSAFIRDPFTESAYFNYMEFEHAVDIAVKALDVIIDENKDNHALPEQKRMALDYRNIGLGIMGLYDAMVKLGLRYGSQQSINFASTVMDCMLCQAIKTSHALAKKKGAFPKFSKELIRSHIFHTHSAELEFSEVSKYGLRNCSLISIAPSGSIGTMLDISTGCEPAFNISYKRKTESLNGKDKYYDVYIGVAKEYFNVTGEKKLPYYFVTASDIDWHERIDMQSALQEHVDTGISSTINLHHDITLEEIEKLYLYAWESGLKGVTIFRDGCKRTGILSTDDNNDSSDTEDTDTPDSTGYSVGNLPRGVIIKADDNCIGKKRTLTTGCGSLHISAYFDPDTGDLLETYFNKGSQGGCEKSLTGLSRMISLAARGGVDIYSIVDQLKSSGVCPSYATRRAVSHDTSTGSSCPVAIGYALLDMYQELQQELDDSEDNEEVQKVVEIVEPPKPEKIDDVIGAMECPECHSRNIAFEGGCISCKNCGWSKCG